jgi:hypothetical protein
LDRKPSPSQLRKSSTGQKKYKDTREVVVSPKAVEARGEIKGGVPEFAMESMMELMAGVRDSLKEVVGGMQELRKDRERVATFIPV